MAKTGKEEDGDGDAVADAHGDGDGAVNDHSLLLQQVETGRGRNERMGIRKCVPADALYIL